MDDLFSVNFQSRYILFYILLGIASLGISWWSYLDVSPQISKIKRYLLIFLRSSGILLIGVLLLEPLLSLFSEKVTGTDLGVAVDVSSSMQVKEDESSRYKIAKTSFNEYMPKNVHSKLYGFSDTLVELNNFPDSSTFIGLATNIAGVFNSELVDNDKYGALLVITDGAGNVGENPFQAAAKVNLPVYSLVVGSGISQKDVFVSAIDYPPVGYINTEFAIGVEIGASGYQGKTGLVEIRDEKKILSSKNITFPADGAYISAEFKLSIAEAGAKNFSVAVSRFDDETYKDNNIRNFSIKFLKDKINILLLSSSLNWEFTYLIKALGADRHFNVSTAIAKRRGGFNTNEIPVNLEIWKKIELVIAIDLNVRSLGSQMNNLKAAVESGTGFLYIAGDNSKVSRLSGFDDILPVKASAITKGRNGEFFPMPGRQARVRTIMEIDGLKWSELPPLKYILTGLDIDEGALVFLNVIDDKGEYRPVLVGARYKFGKTAAITGYPWWPRYFRINASAADKSRIEKFWGNLVRWLVVRDDLERFNISPDKDVYKLGEPVSFSSILFDDNYNLLSTARIEVVISDSTGTRRELQLTGRKPGQYSGVFGSPAAGKYNYNAYAVINGDTAEQANGSFIVEKFSLEMENPSANFALMEQIASITGGRSYTPDNFNQFAQDLKLKVKRSDIVSEYRITGNKYILLIIILLFTLEWGIRKFSQLA